MPRPLWDAATSFGSGLSQRLASLQRPVQLASCAAVVLSCLLLAGCTSPRYLVDIYLISFACTAPPNTSNETAGFSPFEIRAGYFSLCARVADSANWICGDCLDIGFLGIPDPWNLGKTARDYRNEVVSPTLIILSIAVNMVSMLVVSSFPIPRETGHRITPYRRKLMAALVVTPIYNTLTALVVALWQHAAAATAAPLVFYMSSGAVKTVVGPAAAALAWLVFCLSLVTGAMSIGAAYTMDIQGWENDGLSNASEPSLNLRMSEWRTQLAQETPTLGSARSTVP